MSRFNLSIPTARASRQPGIVAVVCAAVLLVGAARGAAGSPPAERPCAPLAPGDTVRIDLKDVPLRKVARLVSCAAEMNLLFRPADLGDRRVTFVAPRPVTLPGLRALFRATLAGEGMILERRGGYHVIRPDDSGG